MDPANALTMDEDDDGCIEEAEPPLSPVEFAPSSPQSPLPFDGTCVICLSELLPNTSMPQHATSSVNPETGRRPPLFMRDAIDATTDLENPLPPLLAAHNCTQLRCGHVFHSSCIAGWFSTVRNPALKGSCPMCRNCAHSRVNLSLVASRRNNLTRPTMVDRHHEQSEHQPFYIGIRSITWMGEQNSVCSHYVPMCFALLLTCAMIVFVLTIILFSKENGTQNKIEQRAGYSQPVSDPQDTHRRDLG